MEPRQHARLALLHHTLTCSLARSLTTPESPRHTG